MGAAQGRVTRDDSSDTLHRSERNKVSMRGGDGGFVPYIGAEHGWNKENLQSHYEVDDRRSNYVKSSGPPMGLNRNGSGEAPVKSGLAGGPAPIRCVLP